MIRQMMINGLGISVTLTAIVCGALAPGVARANTTIINDNNGQTGARDAARRAAVAQAHGEVERAQAMLTASTERIRATWKANPQLLDAEKAVEDARKDFVAAQTKVRDRMKNDPKYADDIQTFRDARSNVHTEQMRTNATQPATIQPPNAAEPGPNLAAPSSAQMDAATEKLKATSRLRDLEADAIANDPEAAKAKDKLSAAQQAAKVWKLQFDAALLNDPEYKSALDQLAAAHAHVEAAAAANY